MRVDNFIQGRWLALLLVILSGCTGYVTRQIEHPGHDNRTQLAPFRKMLQEGDFRRQTMPVSPGLRLAYWYGRPRGFDFQAHVHEVHTDRRFHIDLNFQFGIEPDKAPALPARGSVVLLHPWGMEGSALTLWGLSFASAGYVVVMPDLRGQGASSEAPVGYGPREADDILALVRALRAAGRLPDPLYLFGVSYGATVALFAAPKLARVQGVIAMEPYANAAAVIRRAPASGLFGPRWLGSLIRPREVDAAIKRASGQLGVDLARIDPGEALAKTPACVLILRGAQDNLVTDSSLRRLSRRSARASYVQVSKEGHLDLPLRTDRLLQPLLDWMAGLARDRDAACPDWVPLSSAYGLKRVAMPGASKP